MMRRQRRQRQRPEQRARGPAAASDTLCDGVQGLALPLQIPAAAGPWTPFSYLQRVVYYCDIEAAGIVRRRNNGNGHEMGLTQQGWRSDEC